MKKTLLACLLFLAALVPQTQARAKVTGLIGGTGYVEVTLQSCESGWTYIVWAYDVIHKQLYKSTSYQTDKSDLVITVEVPVEQSQYQVLVIQLKPPAPTPTPAPTPEVTPAPTPEPDTVTTVSMQLRTSPMLVSTKSAPTLVARIERALDGLFGATAWAEEPVASSLPPSGIVVIDYLTPEQQSRLTLDGATNSIVLGDDTTTRTMVDLTQAGKDPDPINSGGHQLLPGVLLSTADQAQGLMMLVDLVEVPVMSADILKTAFSPDVFTSATAKFSSSELVNARRVLQAFRDEALKVYEAELEKHRQEEAQRAREQLLNNALRPK